MSVLRVITPTSIARPCANAECSATVEDRTRGGRPRLYCSKTCKDANAQRIRKARRAVERQAANLSAHSKAVGFGETVTTRDLDTSTHGLARSVAEVTSATAALATHTRGWVEQPRRLSRDGRDARQMAALVDDVIPELKHLLDTLMRRSPTWEVEQIRVHARLLARAAQDLAAMHGAYDPPPAMTFPESLENWADPALERIAVRKSGRPAAWD